MESLKISVVLKSDPDLVYSSWLDTGAHGAMIGADALIDPTVGGKFAVWDGYITGHNIELIKGKKIVQAWRTTDFPKDAPDSKIEIDLESIPEGTRLTMKHTDIPDGQSAEYQAGWLDYYFEPMKDFFGKLKG